MKKRVMLSGFASILLMSTIVFSCSTSKPSASDTAEFIQAIDSGKWVFTVSSVLPQGARSRQPNGLYTVSFNSQELNVYLPYVGRAYSGADILNGSNPLSFVSSDFKLEKQRLKDDRWRMVFQPNNHQQVQVMTFDVFDNGAASLDVTLLNRSPISYRGNLRVKK